MKTGLNQTMAWVLAVLLSSGLFGAGLFVLSKAGHAGGAHAEKPGHGEEHGKPEAAHETPAPEASAHEAPAHEAPAHETPSHEPAAKTVEHGETDEVVRPEH